MKVALSTSPITGVTCDVLFLPVFDNWRDSGEIRKFDEALGGGLKDEIQYQEFSGHPREELWYQTHGELPARIVVLLGCDPTPSIASWQRIADTAARHTTRLRAAHAAVVVATDALADGVFALREGIGLARYQFGRFRSKPTDERPLTLTLLVPTTDAALQRAVSRSGVTAAATCYARDLANTPAAALTPRLLAKEARRLAKQGLSVKVHDRRGIRRLKMGALLGVAAGSREDPCFIELNYRPARKSGRCVALVGKGITFDSGGLSLKSAESMQAQKRDMAGAAIVLAVMKALPELHPAVEVRGYIPAAENMPSGSALRPGDVLRAFNGKTIEVLNTDAEGRLVLADALSYAASKKPDVMLDFATLTATVRNALGSRYAAIMGTDRKLVMDCVAAGAAVGENFWELPLVSEYRRDLDSRIADLKNTGEGQAGTIIGGLFLREFVGNIPWAHIDFSSTVMSDGFPCHPKGASGFGVRTVLRYLMESAAGK